MSHFYKEFNKDNFSGFRSNSVGSKIREMIRKSSTCFFQTKAGLENSNAARPIRIQKTDADGTLWFIGPNNMVKDSDFLKEKEGTLIFKNNSTFEFLEINGTMEVSQDANQIHELWDNYARFRFVNGEKDPRISVIKFKPKSENYWNTNDSQGISGLKSLLAAISGKKMWAR